MFLKHIYYSSHKLQQHLYTMFLKATRKNPFLLQVQALFTSFFIMSWALRLFLQNIYFYFSQATTRTSAALQLSHTRFCKVEKVCKQLGFFFILSSSKKGSLQKVVLQSAWCCLHLISTFIHSRTKSNDCLTFSGWCCVLQAALQTRTFTTYKNIKYQTFSVNVEKPKFKIWSHLICLYHLLSSEHL